MIRRPPRSTLSSSSAASDVYKRQLLNRTPVKLGMRLDQPARLRHTQTLIAAVAWQQSQQRNLHRQRQIVFQSSVGRHPPKDEAVWTWEQIELSGEVSLSHRGRQLAEWSE